MSCLLIGVVMLAGAAPPRQRTVEFMYKAVVSDMPVGAGKIEVWVPVPHDSPFQHITKLAITSPYPYQLLTGQYGNQVLHLSLDKPPRTGFAVDVRFTAVRREHVQARLQTPAAVGQSKPDPAMARWLQPDRLVPIDGKVRQWAREVVDSAGATTDLDKARAIYNHVIATVKYDKTGTGWGRGDIYYACDARRGNCTDFHAIFIGYCRAVGIPARFAIGFSLPTDRPAGEVSGYHCWAEFWAKGIGWVPVDASEAAKNPAKRQYFFGAHDENRIEFSIGRDLLLYPGQAQPLNYFIYPYAEVDGQPVATMGKTFTYQNLTNE